MLSLVNNIKYLLLILLTYVHSIPIYNLISPVFAIKVYTIQTPIILLLLTIKLSYKTLLLRIIYAKYKKFMLVYTRKIECLTKRVLIHYFVGVGLHTKSDFK